MPPRINGLMWTEEAEEHIEEHIDPGLIEELIQSGNFFAFPNKKGHPPKRWRIIGRLASGEFVTAILEEPERGDPFAWKPVTGWFSDHFERDMFVQEQERIAKKRGG